MKTNKKEQLVYRKRILIYGDYSCATGFSTVTTAILRQLQNTYKDAMIDVVAINWYGDLLPEDYEIQKKEAGQIIETERMINGKIEIRKVRKTKFERKNTTVYSAFHHDGKEDLYGRNAFASMVHHFSYDLVFMIQDIPVFYQLLEMMKTFRQGKKAANHKQFKVMVYFPVDGTMLLPEWFENFDIIDKIVAYTDYAKQEVLKVRPDLKISVIHHGINREQFFYINSPEVEEFREVYFGAENKDKFIISNINRNQTRKDIPTTILAFQEYRNVYNKEAFLYLHMNPQDPQGWDLYTLLRQTNLVYGQDYMFPSKEHLETPPEPEFLNMIYNASDAYLTTTTGEGFGLTILEAMATKTPVIAPLHTSIAEINGHRGRMYLITAETPYVSTFDNFIRIGTFFRDVVEEIRECQEDDVFNKKKKVNSAYDFSQTLDWNVITGRWMDEFKKLL